MTIHSKRAVLILNIKFSYAHQGFCALAGALSIKVVAHAFEALSGYPTQAHRAISVVLLVCGMAVHAWAYMGFVGGESSRELLRRELSRLRGPS